MIEIKHILVPTDFGEASDRALDLAVELANKYGASLTLMHAYEVPLYTYQGVPPIPVDYWTPVRDGATRRLELAVAELQKRVPEAKGVLTHGAPWEEILGVAKESGASLIVMGTHGRRGVVHAILGSVAEKIVRLAPVPVLTVRGTEGSS